VLANSRKLEPGHRAPKQKVREAVLRSRATCPLGRIRRRHVAICETTAYAAGTKAGECGRATFMAAVQSGPGQRGTFRRPT